jgi:pyridoxamine 5'-phosphate oxidase family protein
MAQDDRQQNESVIMSETYVHGYHPRENERLRSSRLLGRLATVGPDGMPHVTPLGCSLGPGEETIEVRGRNFAATKKFRDLARTHRAAIVIDEVLPPWQPRRIEIRGNAEALNDPEPRIVIHPTCVISWGLDDPEPGQAARDTS